MLNRSLFIVVALVFCSANTAFAQRDRKPLESGGRVATVSQQSVTIETGRTKLVLDVDATTKVVGKGVGTKSAEIKRSGREPNLTDLVTQYDSVRVKYVATEGGKYRATQIDIKSKAYARK